LGVTSLHLDWNGLDQKSGAELAEAFRAIPLSVTSLDLRWNGLDDKTDAEWIELFSSLPFVHTVVLGDRRINKYELYANQLLEQVEHLVLTDAQRLVTPLIPGFEIDEISLSGIIGVLEKRNTSAGYLVSAMLLDDMIQNIMRGEEPQSQEKYDEKRAYDAVSFYIKAATSQGSDAIKDTANFNLWQLKTLGGGMPSLKRRLEQFDIRPPERFVGSYGLFDSHKGAVVSQSLRGHEEPVDDNDELEESLGLRLGGGQMNGVF